MADKIVVMNKGNVEQIGAPPELYDYLNNLFVAGFIGSPAMNFVKGRINNDAFHADVGTVLPLPAHGGGGNGRLVVSDIRLEHFQLRDDGSPAKRVACQGARGRADRLRNAGHGRVCWRQYHCRFPRGRFRAMFPQGFSAAQADPQTRQANQAPESIFAENAVWRLRVKPLISCSSASVVTCRQ